MIHNLKSFLKLSVVLCFFSEASEKLLKTWQENEDKADGYMKVGRLFNS